MGHGVSWVLAALAAATPSPASAPRLPHLDLPAPSRIAVTSPPVLGLGPKLASRIRDGGEDARYTFLAEGLDPALIVRHGGTVTARIGPIVSGSASGRALLLLAPLSRRLDAPQSLRPMLDVSRAKIGADLTDTGDGFTAPLRGEGALVGLYDSGVDLGHPDLRDLSGKTRVAALWDQDANGTPPEGQVKGAACTRMQIDSGQCAAQDRAGHGTLVAAIAAGSGPRYRGVAPSAELLVAASERFEDLVPALAWFDAEAKALGRPLVVNLSLGGHEGAHDGTSLEAQAIEAYGRLVIAAAGNDGEDPIHAALDLSESRPNDVALAWPGLADPVATIVEVWGEPGKALSAKVIAVASGGTIAGSSSAVSPGDLGKTESLVVREKQIGRVRLDAEVNSANRRPHVRVELALPGFRSGAGLQHHVAVRVLGAGRGDVWVDAPAYDPAPPKIDAERTLGLDTQVLGDTSRSVSDPATAPSAIAVSSYVSRASVAVSTGTSIAASAAEGAIAASSSRGPTADPDRTGAKPTLAAPGELIVSARAQPAADRGKPRALLYEVTAGTSMATPHVSGAAAVLLGAKHDLPRSELSRLLITSADGDVPEGDERWGAGKLDVAAAARALGGTEAGCGCRAHVAGGRSPAWALLALAFLLPRLRARGARAT